MVLEGLGGVLGGLGAVLRALGGLLGPSWGLLGRSWRPSWALLDALLGVSGACSGDLEAYLEHAFEEDSMKTVIPRNIEKKQKN